MTPSRTWFSTNGRIMPCSSDMRRIHLSDFTLMVSPLCLSRLQTLQFTELFVELGFDHPLRDRDEGRQVRRAGPGRFGDLEDHARPESLQDGLPPGPLERRPAHHPVSQLLELPLQRRQERLAALEGPLPLERSHLLSRRRHPFRVIRTAALASWLMPDGFLSFPADS